MPALYRKKGNNWLLFVLEVGNRIIVTDWTPIQERSTYTMTTDRELKRAQRRKDTEHRMARDRALNDLRDEHKDDEGMPLGRRTHAGVPRAEGGTARLAERNLLSFAAPAVKASGGDGSPASEDEGKA